MRFLSRKPCLLDRSCATANKFYVKGAAQMETNDIQNPESEIEASVTEQKEPTPKPAGNKRAPIGIISSFLPVATGILALVAGFDCSLNSKYLGGLGETLLAIAVLVSVIFPLICPIAFKRDRDLSATEKAKWLHLIPAIASFYLSGYTLLNDLGEWGDAILLLSLLAGVFFILKIIDGKEAIKIGGICCLLLLGTAIIALLYLDFDIELNSHFKLAVQLGAVGLMLGTIADARAILSRIGTGWFMLLKSIASSLCLVCAGLIFVAFARGFTVLPQIYLACAVLYSCYAVSAIGETFSLSRSL